MSAEPLIANHCGCRIVVEKQELCFGAYCPEVPGIGCVGENPDDAPEYMKEALERAMRDRVVKEKHRTVIRGTGIHPGFVAALVKRGPYGEVELARWLGISIADVKACVWYSANN